MDFQLSYHRRCCHCYAATMMRPHVSASLGTEGASDSRLVMALEGLGVGIATMGAMAIANAFAVIDLACWGHRLASAATAVPTSTISLDK